MQTISKYIIMLALELIVSQLHAQRDSIQNTVLDFKVDKLIRDKELIKTEERDNLKKEVEAINDALNRKEITEEEAESLKLKAAKKRALNIENRMAIINNKIEFIKRNADETIDGTQIYEISSERVFGVKVKNKNTPKQYDRRTYSQLVFAAGVNWSIIEGQSLNDSPYDLIGSETGFAELGWAWKTRVFKNSNVLRLKYGFSFQWNKLSPKDNKYFAQNDDGVVSLETFDFGLDKSKIIISNLVFPLHFEFGPSKKIEKKTYFRYSTFKKFKMGIGGYAGFNVGVRQKLKYNQDGRGIKQKIKGGYNTSNFVYGISSYVAWGGVALYTKYDLSPIFKNQAVKQNNLSIGLRLDMD